MNDIAQTSPYGYIPTRWICLLFIALFAVSTIFHTAQAFRYRMWWLFPTAVLAGIGEITGWGGRLWSSYSLYGKGFTMQITATIVSPTPLLAVNFIILGRLIPMLGSQYSRLSARLYSRIFLTCDVIALTVQAIGGSMASAAKTQDGATRGGRIALAGVAFQLAVISIFTIVAGEYFVRLYLDKPVRFDINKDVEMKSEQPAMIERNASTTSFGPYMMPWISRSAVSSKLKMAIGGLSFSTFVLLVRGIYRSIELAGGWHGVIIHTQVYFNVFDAAMIVLAMYTLNLFHPGHLLRS